MAAEGILNLFLMLGEKLSLSPLHTILVVAGNKMVIYPVPPHLLHLNIELIELQSIELKI